MKSLLHVFCICVLLLSFRSSGQTQDPGNGTLSDDPIVNAILSNPELIKQAFSEMAYLRCKRFLTMPGKIFDTFYVYRKGKVLLNTNLACNKSAQNLIKVLDFYQEKVIETNRIYYLRLVFKSKLIELMNNDRTLLVLKNVLSQMKSDYFNLYDSVYEILNSKEKTLEFLGVLFQDFSPERLHYNFLKMSSEKGTIKTTKVFAENLELLEATLGRLSHLTNGDQIITPDGTMTSKIVEFFPIKSLLNLERVPSMAYHFWVPSNVAFQLSRSFDNSDAHSYLAAFSFNYFYETLFNKGLSLSKWSTIKQILSLEDMVITQKNKAYDIYLGHEGAFFALDYINDDWTPEKFVKQIMERPFPAYHAAVQHITRY